MLSQRNLATSIAPLTRRAVPLVAAVLALATARAGAQCLEWTRGFHGVGMDAPVLALHSYDDGGGPVLFAGGQFVAAGEAVASRVARFDGVSWSALGAGGAQGTNGPVNALVDFDDGSGRALYVAGNFTEAGGVFTPGVARWNGTSWSALSGATDDEVLALAVFDSGSGPELYAAGHFVIIGGVSAAHVARWTGSGWAPLGSGTNQSVRALHVHDDGSGPVLWVGGDFSTAGGITTPGLARWNGASWSAGAVVSGGSVFAMETFPAGSTTLVVGGGFTHVAGVACSRIARWNGTSWSALGSGVNGIVRALRSFDDGTGEALWTGGDFTLAGGSFSAALARWSGTSWSNPGAQISGGDNGGPTRVGALEVLAPPGASPRLCIGGTFTDAAGTLRNRIVSWDGATWDSVGLRGNGLANRWYQGVGDLAVFDPGSGPVLCAAGSFAYPTAQALDATVACWDGATWSALAALPDSGAIPALTVFDLGAGPELVASASLDGIAPDVVRWTGSTWVALGSVGFSVLAFASFDDGAGTKLYAAGRRYETTYFGPVIKRWNGASWEALAGGAVTELGTVYTMVVHDDGSGPALCVGGQFLNIGTPSIPVRHTARWNGASWTALGSASSGLGDSVRALCVFDEGSGPRLFAGSTFTTGVRRWVSGTTWSLVGAPLGTSTSVRGLEVFDDGSGPALYAAGVFDASVGSPFSHIARWNGTTWSSLGSGFDGGAGPMAVYDDGSGEGPALYVVGGRTRSGDFVTSGIARWRGCRVTSFCAADGLDPLVTQPCPCGNTGAPGRGCAWNASSSGALLEVDGRIDPDTMVLRGSQMPATTTSIYLKGDATNIGGTVFGDGVRCVDGNLIRLALKVCSGGASQFPEPGNASLSVRGLTPPGSGLTAYYQTYFRAAAATFCPPATFNATNGIVIRW